MPIATVTSKGQITLPASVRSKLRLVSGTKVVLEEQPNGDFLVRRKSGDMRALQGFFPKPAQPLSIRDMDEAIERTVTESDARSRQ